MADAHSTCRVLLVDDEPLVRTGIRGFLQSDASFTIVGEARDGNEAVSQIEALTPDLVFLDVQMPERDGFAVLDAIAPESRPVVVFVTAFDAYAVRAFDVNAVDYLVKPFDESRFRLALDRAASRVAQVREHATSAESRGGPDDNVLETLMRALRRDDAAGNKSAHRERLLLRIRDRTLVVNVDDVDWFESDDNYVRLHGTALTSLGLATTGSAAPLLRETLTALAASLDPTRFARVHRSALIRLAAVRALEPLFHGELSVVLHNGDRVTVGRSYRAEFEARLQGLSAER